MPNEGLTVVCSLPPIFYIHPFQSFAHPQDERRISILLFAYGQTFPNLLYCPTITTTLKKRTKTLYINHMHDPETKTKALFRQPKIFAKYAGAILYICTYLFL